MVLLGCMGGGSYGVFEGWLRGVYWVFERGMD